MTVANETVQTIYQQIGGQSFAAITGSKNFLGTEDGLWFQFKAAPNHKVNKCFIQLTDRDTYTMEFWWIRGTKIELKETVEDVYSDQLEVMFESKTGLYTHF